MDNQAFGLLLLMSGIFAFLLTDNLFLGTLLTFIFFHVYYPITSNFKLTKRRFSHDHIL